MLEVIVSLRSWGFNTPLRRPKMFISGFAVHALRCLGVLV